MSKVLVGSVSHGTMRDEDLIPAFLSALEEIAGATKADNFKLSWWEELWDLATEHCPNGELGDMTSALFDELQDLAPYGLYFGPHPGDGSDYGFWPHEDLIQDMKREVAEGNRHALHDGSSEQDDLIIQERYTGYSLFVNKRGNMTMWEYVNGQNVGELWSCV